MQFTLLEGFEGWSTDKDGILTFPMFKSVPRDPQPLRPDAQGRLKLPKLPNHGSGLKRPKVARRNLTKIVYNIIHWKLLTLIPINLEDHLWTKTISFISSNLKNQTKQISIITMMLRRRDCEADGWFHGQATDSRAIASNQSKLATSARVVFAYLCFLFCNCIYTPSPTINSNPQNHHLRHYDQPLTHFTWISKR